MGRPELTLLQERADAQPACAREDRACRCGAANAAAYFIHALWSNGSASLARRPYPRARSNAARLHAPGAPRLTRSSLGLRV